MKKKKPVEYKLGFTGQLFAEQLKSTYPEVKKLLGEKSLIEPLELPKKKSKG